MMRAPNHVIGGFVFTRLFGSFLGFNVLGSSWSIAVCVFASLLPDIDHPGSILGRIFSPISKAINKRYGHRTITHSAIFWIGSTALYFGICNSFGLSSDYVAIYGLAFFSHLLFDMMTIQGVPIFYPFLKNRFVIPGRADMRLNTRDPRSEIIVFVFFGLSLFFMKDLFAQGFWTSYNKKFGTIMHLHAEFLRSDKAISVTYDVSQLSESYEGVGVLLDCTSTSFTVLDGSVRHFDLNSYHFSGFKWVYTDDLIMRDRTTFYQIPLDSLQHYLSQPIMNLKIRSDQTLLWQDNHDIREAKFFSSKFNNGLLIDGCKGCNFSGSFDLVNIKCSNKS